MSPTLNGSSAIRHFKHSNVSEICNRNMREYNGHKCLTFEWVMLVMVVVLRLVGGQAAKDWWVALLGRLVVL